MRRNPWPIAFAFVVAMLGTTLPTPLYPIYVRAYGFDPLIITIIFATYAFGVVGALLLFGRLSDQIGRKPVLLGGLLLSLMSALVLLFADGLAPMLLARIFSGISAGVFTGSATAFVIDLTGTEQRTRGAAIAVAANIGGLGLGTLLSGVLAQYAPFPLHTVYAVDVVLVVLSIAAVLCTPETVVTEGHARLRIQRLHVPANVRHVFFQAVVAGICSFAVAGLLSSIAPSFLGTVLALPNHALAGLPIFAMMGTSALGQLLIGRIDRLAALRAATMLLLAGILLLAASVWLRSAALLFAASIIEGLGQGIGIGSGLAEINQRVCDHRAEVTSTYFVLLYLGLACPIIAVGLIADRIGLVNASLIFCTAIAVTLVIILATQLRSADATSRR